MNTDELLTRLARLDQQDLSWLLAELPPAMRRDLTELLSAEDEPPVEPAASPVPQPAGWEALDAERAAAALNGEPAWLVSAATRGADAEWRERFLHAMASRRRHDIEIADRSGRPLGARAARLLLDGCRARIESEASGEHAPARSGFAALVHQMRSRFA